MKLKRKSLSLCMIVRNEEDSLSRCLKSAKNVVDEIIVVDTGSVDATREIAKSFGAKVLDFKWSDNFSEARNFALSHCSKDYILYLDADEELPELSRSAIQKILYEIEEPLALKCKIKNIDDFSSRIHYGVYCRFFPNLDGVKFHGRVHEQVEISLLNLGVKVYPSDIEIIHHGYNISTQEKKKKARRNLQLLLEEFSLNPSDYFAYQLGLTYSILEDEINAEKFFSIALQSESLPEDYKIYSYEFLINKRLKEKNLAEAKILLKKIFSVNLTHPSIFLLASKVYAASKDFEQSITFAISSYELNRTPFANKKLNLVFEQLNDYEIIYHGLEVALLAESKDAFHSFIGKLQKDLKEEKLAEILVKLYRNTPVSNKDEYFLIEKIDELLLNPVIELLRKYSDKNSLRNLLVSIYEKFPDNPLVRITFADYLASGGEVKMAEELLNDYLEKFHDNPFVAFYLISLYLERNQLNKIMKPVEYLGKYFPDDPDVLIGLKKISNKLFQTT